MPSLRQKVTTYFRQLSFIAEPRDSHRNSRKAEDDDNFIIKYLEGRMERMFVSAPEIFNSQNPTDLPLFAIGPYPTGPDTITSASTGPDEGLTGIKRSKLHLSASFADDIDFIDTIQDNDCFEVRNSMNPTAASNSSNARNLNKFNKVSLSRKLSSNSLGSSNLDQSANKATGNASGTGIRSRKNSKTSLSNSNKESAKVASLDGYGSNKSKENFNKKATTILVSMVSTKAANGDLNDQNNKNTINEKTEMQSTAGSAAATKKTISNISGALSPVKPATNKLLEDATERLLREAVSNQNGSHDLIVDTVASVSNWKTESESAYGISVSLYENNMLTKEPMGNPIADCYGIVVRDNVAAMALADGVNWGDGARLAARSAVHGCLDYLDRAVFGLSRECMATSTQEVFISLLRSLWEGHGCILEVGGALSTLTIAIVLPLSDEMQIKNEPKKYVVCGCNVGDSLGYIYSKKHGVREFTQASHDITSMRDMRDALGALGPADGNKPELSNLTFSLTTIEHGDIVFLTSDGISDNFDPVVGKFAEAWTADVKFQNSSKSSGSSMKPNFGVLAPKRQNKSASALNGRLQRNDIPSSPPVRPPRSKKSSSPVESVANNSAPSRPKYMRSHTVIEPRRLSSAGNSAIVSPNRSPTSKIPISSTGLPLVTGPQRHALTLYRLEDLLSYGINGTFQPCISARRLCHLLIDFVRMITSARRKTLEQRELFYKLSTGPDGIKREVELNRLQHRAARKRIVDSTAFTALPGKLDHATVVAYTVGCASNSPDGLNITFTKDLQKFNSNTNPSAASPLQSKEFKETNF